MGFEVFTRGKGRKADTSPEITVYASGSIRLNPPAFAALGEPGAVQFLFDRDRRLIGIRSAPPAADGAYRIRHHAKAQHVVSGRLFCRFYEIPTDKARRLPAHMEADLLIAGPVPGTSAWHQSAESGLISPCPTG